MTFMAGNGQADELRFRFKQGDKFSLVSVNEQKMVHPPAPKGQDAGADSSEAVSQQTLRLECDFDIEEVEDNGCAWGKYAYRRVALKVREKDVDIDYDSDASRPASPDSRASQGGPAQGRGLAKGGQKMPPQVLPFYLALGETFFVRITPQGRITNVNGLSAVVGNAKSKIPNVAIKDQLIQVIDRQFAEDKIRRALEDQLAVFPDANSGPVSIGDAWSRRQLADEDKISFEWIFRLRERRPAPILDTNAQPSSKAVVTDQISKFDSVPQSQNWCWVVDVNVVVSSDANEAPISVEGLKATREVSGQGTGQIEIEESTGRIINSVLAQDVVEKIRFLTEGAIRRPPPAPAPARTHIVTTFQMIKRDSDPAPASPDASRGGPEPNRPALSKVEGP
jgi:hypothetical protein